MIYVIISSAIGDIIFHFLQKYCKIVDTQE